MNCENEVVTDPATATDHSDHSATNARVASNAVTYFVGQLLSWVAAFLTVSLIPRRLGEDAWGQIAAVGSAVGLVGSICMCGAEGFLVAEIGRNRSRSEALLRALLAYRITLLPLLIGGGYLSVMSLRPDQPMWTLAWITIGIFATSMLSDPFRAILSGWEAAKTVSLMDLALVSAPLISLPFLKYGAAAYIGTSLCAGILMLLVRARVVGRSIGIWPKWSISEFRMLTFGGAPFLANELTMSLYSFSTYFVLTKFAGTASAGQYAQSQKLFGTLLFVPTAAAYAIMPAMARLNEVDPAQMRRLQERVLTVLLIMAMPVIVLTVLLGGPLCTLLYGTEKFREVPQLLQILSIKLVPLYVVTVCYRFLIAEKKNGMWSLVLLCTVGINFLAARLLIPYLHSRWGMGASGGVIAGVIAESLSMVAAFAVLRWNPLNARLLNQFGRAILAGGVMTLVVYSSRGLFIVIPAALGLITFFAMGLSLHMLGEEEQAKLADLIKTKLSRIRRT